MHKRAWGIAIVLVICAAAIGCVTYQYPPSSNRPVVTEVAPAGGSDQPFYDDLAPYGRWVYVTGPGWVWSPHNLQAGWRPYQLGHWVFTDYGWTWASDEQWGWAVYHYGRWHQDASVGWVWVPGAEWGPAWVAWNEGGGYVGWAPLPWQVRVQAGVGIDWAGVNVTISPNWWCFTSARYLVDPGLRTHIVPPARNVSLIQVTKNVTNYTYIDNRIVNQGVRVEKIGRAVGRTIPRYRIAESDAPEVTRGGKVDGEDFVVFKPDPGRGRKSHGRTDPPGHDIRNRGRDFRQAADDARQQVAPPATEQPPTTQPPAPPEPPAMTNDREPKDRGNHDRQNRGRKILDDLVGKPPARRTPHETAPPQPPPPGQPQDAASQPPATTAPPADVRQNSPASGDRQNTTPPPPARSEPARGQAAREKGKEARDAAAKGRKPKPDTAKSDDKNQEEPKNEKPDSED